MITALIFAGGVGARMKSKEIPKQFLLVEGKPIIIHTLEHFANHDMVDNIVVVCLESWIEELKRGIEKYNVKKAVDDILVKKEIDIEVCKKIDLEYRNNCCFLINRSIEW